MAFLKDSGIYKILNTKTGDFYIGSAVCLNKRWRIHFHELRKGTHHCSFLQRSWNKYGSAYFVFCVLKFIDDKKDLIKEEQRLIDLEDPTYNSCRNAGSCLGIKRTPEFVLKLKNRIFTDETRQKMSQAQQRMSESTKKKISEKMIGNHRSKGIKRSVETIKKMSDSQKGRKLTEEHRKKLSEARVGRVFGKRLKKYNLKSKTLTIKL